MCQFIVQCCGFFLLTNFKFSIIALIIFRPIFVCFDFNFLSFFHSSFVANFCHWLGLNNLGFTLMSCENFRIFRKSHRSLKGQELKLYCDVRLSELRPMSSTLYLILIYCSIYHCVNLLLYLFIVYLLHFVSDCYSSCWGIQL